MRCDRTALLLPALLLALPLAGCSSSSTRPIASTWGGYPTYLPQSTLGGAAVHTTLDASVSSPALAVPGDPVRVHLGGCTVTVDLLGPSVITAGPESAVAQWQVTFHDATGTVALSPAAFAVLDRTGVVHRLRTVGTAPTTVGPGRTAVLTLAATTSLGEGRLRWIPTGVRAPVVWDYSLETT